MTANSNGSAGFSGESMDSIIDEVILFHGVSNPGAGTNDIPTGGLFLNETDGVIYKNTGSLATPTWTAKTSGAGQDGDEVRLLDTDIANYSSPITAFRNYVGGTADTSEDALTGGQDKAGMRVTATSALIGKTLKAISVKIRKGGAGVGTYYFEVYDNANSLVLTIGSGDLSLLTTTKEWVTMVASGSRVLASGDKIVVRCAANYCYVGHGAGVYDGANTHHSWYYSATWNDSTGNDTAMLIWDDMGNLLNTIDGNTATSYDISSTNNPDVKFQLAAAAVDVESIAINLNKTLTTETELELRLNNNIIGFSSADAVRTKLVSDFTDDTWHFITIPRTDVNKLFLQIYGKSNGVTLSINEVKYKPVSNNRHFHKYLDPTDTAANILDSD